MLRHKINELPKFLKNYPSNTNVRLAVSGLAYCNLTRNISTINFLRHLTDHQLKMSIFRRRKITDSAQIVCSNLLLDLKTEVSITTSVSPPPDIFSTPDSFEFELNELINLTHYHKQRLIPKNPQSGASPTALKVQNFQYYTLELMEFDHTLSDNGTDLRRRMFGYSLGGKLVLNTKDLLTIEIGSAASISLSAEDEGGAWLYDIYFSNHCEKPADQCHKPAGDGLDFQYYYDVLSDEANPQRQLILKANGYPTNKVAACNVVITEPELDPPTVI